MDREKCKRPWRTTTTTMAYFRHARYRLLSLVVILQIENIPFQTFCSRRPESICDLDRRSRLETTDACGPADGEFSATHYMNKISKGRVID
jgi:hypothetical protein